MGYYMKKELGLILFLLIVVGGLNDIVIHTPQIRTSTNSSLITRNSVQTNNLMEESQHELSDTSSSIISSNDITIIQSGEYQPGYNLFVIEKRTYPDKEILNTSLIIMDMDGNILYDVPSTLQAAKFINSTTILYQAPECTSLLNLETNTTVPLNFYGHHDLEYNPINQTIFTFYQYNLDINGTIYVYDHIYEFNQTGSIVWELDTYSFIKPDQWCPFGELDNGYPDVTHSNSIFFDPDENVLYYNSRNVNTFYKIDHSTKEVIWALGEYGNFTLFDTKGNEKDFLFFHAHAVEKIGDDQFILFDNDKHNQTDPDSRVSRIVEISINETTMTANESWTWQSSMEYYTQTRGDADRLPNGNRLGSFSTVSHYYVNIGARYVELNPQGDIVWELNFPYTNYAFSGYRLERFNFAPIIDDYQDTVIVTNGTQTSDEVILTWNTWYNMRLNRRINGSYSLYLDGNLIETSYLQFEKYWHPSIIEHNLGKLDSGFHNVSLAVFDEDGHATYNNFTILVSPLYLTRNGPLYIEKDQIDSLIVWDGVSAEVVDVIISANETTIYSESWQWGIFSIDLNDLAPGIWNISMQISSKTGSEIFSESFFVEICPVDIPVIHSEFSELTAEWNETVMMQWTFSDANPREWQILIDNVLEFTDTWNSSNFTLDWSLPTLSEGMHNVTIVALDIADHKANSTVMISITPPEKPIIIVTGLESVYGWNRTPIAFQVECHGVSKLSLWVDDVNFNTTYVMTTVVNFSLSNWYSLEWLPGIHYLSIIAYNTGSDSMQFTEIVEITANVGDPYADAVIESHSIWYISGSNAIGAPDGIYTLIFEDYESGYITLDMGLDENIIDGTGDDFEVIANIGTTYNVYVAQSLDAIFSHVGVGTGNQSFDLSVTGLHDARYVRIMHASGDYVELDAIVANYYNEPKVDNSAPTIIGPNDFWIWENVTEVTFDWTVFDETPWNYSIFVNDELVDSGRWDGSDLELVLQIEEPGTVNISLSLFDLFGNNAIDDVVIAIRELPTTSAKSNPTLVIVAGGVITSIIVLFLVIRWKKISDTYR